MQNSIIQSKKEQSQEAFQTKISLYRLFFKIFLTSNFLDSHLDKKFHKLVYFYSVSLKWNSSFIYLFFFPFPFIWISFISSVLILYGSSCFKNGEGEGSYMVDSSCSYLGMVWIQMNTSTFCQNVF